MGHCSCHQLAKCTDAKDLRHEIRTIFYHDFELLDAYGLLEMFGALGDKIELITQQAGQVSSSAGPKTLADYGFDDTPDLDLILIPGGIGTIAERQNDVTQFSA